jgi:NADPH:quinone reductase-like Zn-dependent oxidoreductase
VDLTCCLFLKRRRLRADRLIDYTKDDFAQKGETYDIIFDTVGKSPFSRCVKLLCKKGRYLLANPGPLEMIRVIWASVIQRRRVIGGAVSIDREGLQFLKELIEQGSLNVIIDRCYPLEQIAEAHTCVEQGHKKGNVVITVACNTSDQ